MSKLNMLKMLVILVMFVLGSIELLGSDCGVKSIEIDWEWAKYISLDFGPRNVDSGSLFHTRIYVAKPLGTPTPAILGRSIKKIAYDDKSGWYIKISSGNSAFGVNK